METGKAVGMKLKRVRAVYERKVLFNKTEAFKSYSTGFRQNMETKKRGP